MDISKGTGEMPKYYDVSLRLCWHMLGQKTLK